MVRAAVGLEDVPDPAGLGFESRNRLLESADGVDGRRDDAVVADNLEPVQRQNEAPPLQIVNRWISVVLFSILILLSLLGTRQPS